MRHKSLHIDASRRGTDPTVRSQLSGSALLDSVANFQLVEPLRKGTVKENMWMRKTQIKAKMVSADAVSRQ